MDQRFGEEETRRIPAFSLPITPDNEFAPLMDEETINIHPRLRCTLLHKTGCICRDSIAFGFLSAQRTALGIHYVEMLG
ncbi:hypothetical protein B0T18DRAFT_425176 [Schizothecium vesticola]|uniref:Uncharacterized protein n=1 Tax=Schizothecium vesticola TaxID=314040 RepID=A0AA40KD66_9PEZI|nr:hypothetical protein B0T18DRAFT_425176 [Schizothecium vesticola]